jgi:hypothetical protein
MELCHQSLAQIERSRSWAAFSNLKSGGGKKTGYTAEPSHSGFRYGEPAAHYPPMVSLASILITLLLSVTAMSVELFR